MDRNPVVLPIVLPIVLPTAAQELTVPDDFRCACVTGALHFGWGTVRAVFTVINNLA